MFNSFEEFWVSLPDARKIEIFKNQLLAIQKDLNRICSHLGIPSMTQKMDLDVQAELKKRWTEQEQPNDTED